MAEAQLAHRQWMEKKAIAHDGMRTKWGITAGGVVVLATLAVVAYGLHLGFSWASIAGLVFALATLAGAFIYGTSKKVKERIEKATDHGSTLFGRLRRQIANRFNAPFFAVQEIVSECLIGNSLRCMKE